MTEPRAIVYSKTKSYCSSCVKAKALLEKHDITYEEKSAEDNREECFRVVNEATGSDPRTAPQIFIDGQYVGGYEQLVKFLGAE